MYTLIAVLTDQDLVGLGSVSTTEDLVKASLGVLEPYYEGENALEPERVSEKLRRNTFWLGRGGAITHTISGIDIALWDLLGKATGQPVGRLLGGRYRERVRPYASMLMSEPEVLRDELAGIKRQGFSAVKMGWGPFGRISAAMDERIVAAARDVLGPEFLLMVDAGASDSAWKAGFKWALRAARMLDAYDVAWFEEPLPPDAFEDFVALRRQSPVPIAGGEVMTRRQSYRPWLQAGAFDIVQPDVTAVGGISEGRRIAWMAEENGARCFFHGWNTAVGLAADLQLASAIRDTDLVEYITGSAYVDEITAKPWKLDRDGMLPIPAAPGLGIELDMQAVRRYATDARFL
jgi:L-alanine-DL-glutamate epimerase-like enolase superfamily enzyme